jgi:hypothetical protein
MEIKRNGSQACSKGPADYFTGAVRVDSLFQTPDPARVSSASVTFEREPALRGIRIHSVRPLSLPPAADGRSAKAASSRKSIQAT